MNISNLFSAAALAMALPFAVQAQEGQAMPEELDSETKQFSYVVGMDVGQSLRNLEADMDLDVVLGAIRDVVEGNEVLLTQDQAEQIKQAFFQQRQQQAAEEAEAKAQENRAKGETFLAENAQRDGVQTTESGLQYEVIEEGEGASPDADDRVTVHYTGTLIDGTVFDSSRERGEPATFALNQVIPGWTEGLQHMSEGARYKFFIPSDLAYGDRGAGNVIEPGSTLIFDVELQKVESQDQGDTNSNANANTNEEQ